MKSFVFAFLSLSYATAFAATANDACSVAHAGYYNSKAISCTATQKNSKIVEIDQCANGDWGTLVFKTSDGRWLSQENDTTTLKSGECRQLNTICSENYVVDYAVGKLYQAADGKRTTLLGTFNCEIIN